MAIALLVPRVDHQVYDFSLYRYTPALVPAIIAVVLFALGGFVHIFLIHRLKCKIFIPFAIGCFSMFLCPSSNHIAWLTPVQSGVSRIWRSHLVSL
jgi:hypothetical protein